MSESNSSFSEDSSTDGTGGGRDLLKWMHDEKEENIPVVDQFTAASLGIVSLLTGLTVEEVNKRNNGGWSSLMYAAYIGHLSTVTWLLDHGAQPNQRNQSGQTALMLASMCGHEKSIATLMMNGASVHATDNRGWTAIFHACICCHSSVVKLLLSYGANGNIVDPKTGFTPLMLAASEGHQIIVQELLQSPVIKVNMMSHRGDTARSLAMENGFIQIASLIDNFNLTLAAMDDNPLTHKASEGQRPSILDGPQALKKMVNDKVSSTATTATRRPATSRDVDASFSASQSDDPEQTSSSSGEEDEDDEQPFSKFSTSTVKTGGNASPPQKKFSSSILVAPSHSISLSDECSGKCFHKAGPQNLAALLEQLGLSKYTALFQEQDITLEVFLTLTDDDLKEVGVKLFGPRKKMSCAIARFFTETMWHQCPKMLESFADRVQSQYIETSNKLQAIQRQNEQLMAQLSQERQLRSVAENCLVESQQSLDGIKRISSSSGQKMLELLKSLRVVQKTFAQIHSKLFCDIKESVPTRDYGVVPTMSTNTAASALAAQSASSSDQLITQSELLDLERTFSRHIDITQGCAISVLGNIGRIVDRKHDQSGPANIITQQQQQPPPTQPPLHHHHVPNSSSNLLPASVNKLAAAAVGGGGGGHHNIQEAAVIAASGTTDIVYVSPPAAVRNNDLKN